MASTASPSTVTASGTVVTQAGKPRVVIIGCGFGGLEAAKALSDADVEIVVIDRTNHHLFQPLLYQVATAGLPARTLHPRQPPKEPVGRQPI